MKTEKHTNSWSLACLRQIRAMITKEGKEQKEDEEEEEMCNFCKVWLRFIIRNVSKFKIGIVATA